MSELVSLSPWLVAMFGLLCCSGFFSASEASLFSLRPRDRRILKSGTRGEQIAHRLLEAPDRLLSAVLFWNLVVNIAYFTISSVVALRMDRSDGLGQGPAVAFGVTSLLAIIFLGEMVPKSVAVVLPITMARVLSWPISLFVRVLDPLMPWLQGVNLVTKRLLFPHIVQEPYLGTEDLERAIAISAKGDESLIRQEQAVLKNIVFLTDIRVDEWMRPRTQFESYRPPVKLADLEGRVPAWGYLLVTEAESDEIERALRLDNFYELPAENLEKLAEPVLYLPWCATVADALEKLSHRDSEVAVVLNEYGETIGILTIEDILETVFIYGPSRSKRILDRNPFHKIEDGKWIVTGMMSLTYLRRKLEDELDPFPIVPETHSVTVGGFIQEQLQRLAEPGDACQWGVFHLRVLEIENRGTMIIELTVPRGAGSES
jgi:CBS domain containing-hemolysin-like protein